MSTPGVNRRDWPAIWISIRYIVAIMGSLLTLANPAQASGTIANPLRYCAQYTGHLCNIYTTPQYFLYLTADAACQSVYPGNPIYHDYGGGYCTPSGNVVYTSGWLNQPNAVCSGSLCTCNAGYQPDPSGTSCVAVNSCPPNMSGAPCACNAGYVPYPYYSMGCYAAPACPAHSSGTYPSCICDTGYVPSGNQCVPEPYTLELDVPSGSIEPTNTASGNAKTSKLLTARVTGQQSGQPEYGVAVRLTVDVDVTSGGHDHGENVAIRPRGTLTGNAGCNPPEPAALCAITSTDPNGYASFTFTAPEVSGTHTVAASCNRCSNPGTKPFDVKVEGLSQIPGSQFYSLTEEDGSVIGARPGWHTDNHNLTPAAATVLWRLAVSYAIEQRFKLRDPVTGKFTIPPPVLHLNDASLPWGGVYDICARPGACPDLGVVSWQSPHAEHKRGTVVDVRANGAFGSIPNSNKAKFMRLLQGRGVPYLHESIDTSNEHFHLRLMGRRE